MAAAAAAAAAATAAAAAAAAEDLRFGGCGEEFGRFRTFWVVFGCFWTFPNIFGGFRALWDVAKLQKLLKLQKLC